MDKIINTINRFLDLEISFHKNKIKPFYGIVDNQKKTKIKNHISIYYPPIYREINLFIGMKNII